MTETDAGIVDNEVVVGAAADREVVEEPCGLVPAGDMDHEGGLAGPWAEGLLHARRTYRGRGQRN